MSYLCRLRNHVLIVVPNSMPILANDKVVPGLDPYDISTWRFEMDMEESGKLMDLAEVSFLNSLASQPISTFTFPQHNFIAGEAKVKAILKAMWLRKLRARQEAERRHNLSRFQHPP